MLLKKSNKNGKFIRFFNENKYVMLSCAAAFLITQLVAFCYSLIPYGDMTILRMDLYHQYGPLFAEFYDRLVGGSSLVYSWNSGLGSSFIGNYFNYLSSPLSFIVLLFGHKNITEAISCLIMLKAVFSAGTFTYYLKVSAKQNSPVTAGFGVLYAFCGYFIAYYWNVMWLDAMVLFPLIILGIEKIIEKGKPALYTVCLATMIFANYYMAFMICIFCVLYFFCYYFSKYPIGKKFDNSLKTKNIIKKVGNSVFVSSGFKFAVYSLAAGLLAAVTVLPLITILSGSSATSGKAPTTLVKYFSAFDFLANHLAGPDATIRSSGNDVLPNVYCGILTLILVPLYLFSKKITAKEKAVHVALLALLYFSFDINFLNYFWHGFHFPNDLPYRFSFMYSFVLLTMAFKAFCNIKEFSSKELIAVGTGLVFFIVFVEKITSKNVNDKVLLISVVFAVGYVIVLRLFNKKGYQTFAVSVLTLCLICSEVALSSTSNYSMNQSKKNYTVDYDSFQEIKKQLDSDSHDGFYRMELTELRTRMDPCWFGYNGASVFSSMAYEKVSNVQRQLGLYGNYINSYTYMPQTPVYNTMFGLKYIVDKSMADLSNPYYTWLCGNNTFTAYRNSFDLPIAYFTQKGVYNWNAYSYDNPFEAQSELFRLASSVEDVFERMQIEDVTYTNINDFYPAEFDNGSFRYSKIIDNQPGSVSFTVTPASTENIYISFNAQNIESIIVSSALESKSVHALDEPHILDLGMFRAGEPVFIDIDIKASSNVGSFNFFVYTVNEEKFEKGYDILHSSQMNISEFTDTKISGSISAPEHGIVFTSIPYDKCWEVYVDSEKLDSEKIYSISEAFLAFEIAPGEHSITLKYNPKGLTYGIVISCVTALVLGVIFIVFGRRKNRWGNGLTDDLKVTVEEVERKPENQSAFRFDSDFIENLTDNEQE